MDSSALLAHIVSQTRQNVEFLISQRQISPTDGREILTKLPPVPDRTMVALEQQTQNLLITPPPSASPSYPRPPGPHQPQLNSNDLSFRAGDTIEIVAETNLDWWTGRHNGRQGLFPSNYVEKLPAPTSSSPYQSRDSYPSNAAMPSFPNQPAPYQPPTGAYSGPGYQPPPPPPTGGYQPMYQPPPGPPQMGVQYNSYGGPPPPVAQPLQGPAPAAEQPPKKPGKFGNLGNTLAQSAAGGVGFGAGSAVGSGIVNAIF
ncbi:hypothetical protein FB451DRAFT_1342415 [Mycena latifolia]|nr:hypothetical protein FB451DRAFT_1342415 [Mycena latifolia]